MANKENTKSYLHLIDKDMHKKIKIHCINTGQPMKKFYDEAIANELHEQKDIS